MRNGLEHTSEPSSYKNISCIKYTCPVTTAHANAYRCTVVVSCYIVWYVMQDASAYQTQSLQHCRRTHQLLLPNIRQ